MDVATRIYLRKAAMLVCAVGESAMPVPTRDLGGFIQVVSFPLNHHRVGNRDG